MIDSSLLLKHLQARVVALQDDLRARAASEPAVDRSFREEYAAARQAQRTADTFESWREDPVTQAAVAWVLGTVFVRFLEDNGLIDAWISGPGDRRKFALDRHAAYFEQHPLETDREYLLHVFGTVGKLPAGGDVFDAAHNPLWRITPSGDAAQALLEFWQRIDPATGAIAHDFTDPAWGTRLLGDLYQDLSEAARKKYALLQTPDFVERFILDRTLTPAIEAFGYQTVTLIDPTCGSGHFLLGAFERLLAEYERHQPGTSVRAHVQAVLRQVSGIDLNPFAAAIARFRLLIAALRASGVTRLADAPAFDIQVGTGDALLHGRKHSGGGEVQPSLDPDDPSRHHFFAEDPRADAILNRRHHVVVGNPPYIVVRDRALNQLYRTRYASCHMQYSLVVPFIERFFDLATVEPAGYMGLIGGNSFMKREFGSKVIEQFLPRVDLTHVVDTSGAYIPGHGTPTVILFGRNRAPSAPTRTVMGICGEPSAPEDPARGQVWTAIERQIDHAGSESVFVSVRDLEQVKLHTHPWSVGGGGAAELKGRLEGAARSRLSAVMDGPIGRAARTGEDDAFMRPYHVRRRSSLPGQWWRTVLIGEEVRDWSAAPTDYALFPYDSSSAFRRFSDSTARESGLLRELWSLRTTLAKRSTFQGDMADAGRCWWEYQQYTPSAHLSSASICFAFVATHNQFALDRGGSVFNRSAPVIKLPADATEDDHFALLGLLNSSSACYWMKQVFYPKGGDQVGNEGARVSKSPWEDRYEFAGTALAEYPVVPSSPDQARELSLLAEGAPSTASDWLLRLRRMISLQEELDWNVYSRYGLLAEQVIHRGDLVPIALGERAFEIVLARRFAAGDEDTTWFERHGSTPITELPAHWPDDYKALVERRIALIESDRDIALIERPEYKRRWNLEAFEEQQERVRRNRLLDRLENADWWSSPILLTTAALSDLARRDVEWMAMAEAYRGRADFDVTTLVTELVTAEGVPYLPAYRYKESGLRKRAQWEATWALQRQEDAIDARVDLPEGDPQRLTREEADRLKRAQVGDIPVPPKYASADFRKGDYWRLRGKLDVPKERFILYPGAERADDPTPVVGWAGWDHLQQAQALAAYYVDRQNEGWSPERLTPLLAGLLDVVPWLQQWHNDVDPQFNMRLGDYFADYADQQARALGLTLDALRAWTPPEPTRGRKPRKS
ncbi:DNA methylase [Luteitalea sp. TBR-22]|uniref:BREX-2 system adenine-specific DNA-methyltransferase PglX n=1 Tax=Luteitalea sp. TBR-22 TaxID=2802971 RepID=UPI001AF28243|nr:BREX-2 system adenine-specific DNA-methyltransferase PglX [Luteitalea sp. TBR-22]BCS31414.1 DNA methylase [Luteitalea sp. TBR-22]